MANSPAYHFDLWAEFLTVTLAENISRCQLGLNKVKKVRLSLADKQNWPCHFKVILDNERVAQYNHHKTPHSDASYDIDYMYKSPSDIPNGHSIDDIVAKHFIPKALKQDDAFFADAWSLTTSGCIPHLLKLLAFRSVSKMMEKQLNHQGVDLTDDFSVQFYDGENYLSFSYDAIKQDLSRQVQFYMGNLEVKKLATKICFKHKTNQEWFMDL